MQMDSLITGIKVLLCATTLGGFASGAIILSQECSKKTEIIAKRYLRWVSPLIVVLGIMLIVMPSGKTLAAMYVLPKIANSEVIQGEAKEFYELAKKGLKGLIGESKNRNDTTKD